MIISTCILLVFLHSGILFSVHCENQYAENRQFLKVEINLSVLKLMYLNHFVSDLSNLGLKIQIRVFSTDIKRKFNN